MVVLSGCGSENTPVRPAVKPLLEAVYASGFVRAKNEYDVFSEGEGYVVERRVNDGDPVKKGDVLYILSAAQPSARYAMAQQNLEQARRNAGANSAVLAELRAALASARTKMQFDSTNFQRFQNLWDQRATSRIEYDRMKLAYQNSRNEYTLWQSRYHKASDDLQTAYANAQQQVLIASDDSGRTSVRSLIDGRVFTMRKEAGELVRRGEAVAVVGNNHEFYLELSVDELDIRKLKTGQRVLFTVDAFGAKTFTGVVSKIYPLVDTRQQSLRVDAVLAESLPEAFSGLAVEANIVVREKIDALVIPKSFLRGDSLWIKTDGGAAKVAVVKGIETMDEVEILSGVDSTTVLVNQ